MRPPHINSILTGSLPFFTAAARQILPVYVGILWFFSGFLIRLADIPPWWRWFGYINPLRYAFSAGGANGHWREQKLQPMRLLACQSVGLSYQACLPPSPLLALLPACLPAWLAAPSLRTVPCLPACLPIHRPACFFLSVAQAKLPPAHLITAMHPAHMQWLMALYPLFSSYAAMVNEFKARDPVFVGGTLLQFYHLDGQEVW